MVAGGTGGRRWLALVAVAAGCISLAAEETVGSSYDTNGFLAIPDRRWISVRPTGLDAATARLLAKWWPESAKADSDVTDQDLAECNLLLCGGPEMNNLTARMADRLPVKFDAGRFSVGSDVYDQPTHCIAFLHPNPLNPKKYVIVYACNDPAAFAANGFFGMSGGRSGEFLADKNNSMPIRDLTRTPLQVAQAVAQYVRKHQRIAPRSTCFSLTDYIANPEYNDFGACDWLHLAAEVAWPDRRADGVQRYTISLGVRRCDAPELAGPRKGTKAFAKLDLAEEKPTAFDFASLDKKLPLVVTTATRHRAITADTSGKSYVLEEPGAQQAIGGATLLLMRLASQADKDLGIQVVLNRPVMSRIHGEAWPDGSTKDKGTYFAGYHRAIGRYRQPPDHEDGVLILSADKPPVLNKLIADNAGFNFGLVGLEHPMTIQAGQTLVVPVLVVWTARPEQAAESSLLDILLAVKPDLIRQLPAVAMGTSLVR